MKIVLTIMKVALVVHFAAFTASIVAPRGLAPPAAIHGPIRPQQDPTAVIDARTPVAEVLEGQSGEARCGGPDTP